MNEHPWDEDEARVRAQMGPEIFSHLELLQECEQVAFELLGRAEPQHSPVIFQVHATLLVRVLQDLRVCGIVAPLGYTMQLWTIASSCFEAAYALGFVGTDISRAQRWLQHQDMKNAPWPVFDGVDNSIRFLDIDSDASVRRDLAQKEYQLYKYLCLAKHVNPIPERKRYWIRTEQSAKLRLPPFFTPARASEARLGLLLALRAATTALWIFRKAHVSGENTIDQHLVQIATQTAELLNEWNPNQVPSGNSKQQS